MVHWVAGMLGRVRFLHHISGLTELISNAGGSGTGYDLGHPLHLLHRPLSLVYLSCVLSRGSIPIYMRIWSHHLRIHLRGSAGLYIGPARDPAVVAIVSDLLHILLQEKVDTAVLLGTDVGSFSLAEIRD